MILDHYRLFSVRIAEILGSPTEAEDWLRRPAKALNGQRPMDLLGTPERRQFLDAYLREMAQGEHLWHELILPSSGEDLSSLFG